MTDSLAFALAAARSAALVVPSEADGVLVVRGKDRLTWLNGLVTCDLAPRREGDAVYGLAVTPKGRVLTDLIVVVDAERLLVVIPRAMLAEVASTFDHYLIMEDVELTPEPDAFSVTFVHGPKAPEVLAAARAALGTGGLVDRTGLGGAVIVAEEAARSAVAEALTVATEQVGGRRGEEAAFAALCLEEGVPRFGVDFSGQTYPQEAGLERTAISFNKGCYLGQEVVCMLEMRGHVQRRLVQLTVDGAAPPAAETAVTDAEGAHVGRVTSAGVAPTKGGLLALAMVKRAFAEPGQTLKVGEAQARVVRAI